MSEAQTRETRIYWPIGLSRDMPGRPAPAEVIEAALNEYVRSVVDPTTTVIIGWMKKTTGLLTSTYVGMVNDVYVVDDILSAEAAGYDAAMVGPHWDPGLYAAREAAGIPVTGPGESSMLVAQTLGSRFAICTVLDGYVTMLERNIALYGCERRAIPVRPARRFGDSTMEFYQKMLRCVEGTSDQFLIEFEQAARGCIEDGADVIIAGGQLFGPAFQKNNFWTIPGTGVPIVECAACGLKLAELLVGLRRGLGLTTSQHPRSPFRTPPREALERVRRDFLT